MKYIINIITIAILFSYSHLGYSAKALDIALEMNSFQVEFYDASQQGKVRVSDCNQCKQKLYTFDQSVRITKSGQDATLKQLLADQWSAKFPTIFLNPKNKQIILIAY